MKMLCLVLSVAILALKPQPLTAQDPDTTGHAGPHPEFFSEAEVLEALLWGMPEAEARNLARFLSEDPAIAARDPEIRAMWPAAVMYGENMLLLLSLVSAETNEKVERRLIEMRLGTPLSPEERAAWEAKRADFRARLIDGGKRPRN